VQGSHKPLIFKGSPEAVACAKGMVLAWLAAEGAKWCGEGGGGQAGCAGQAQQAYLAADGDFPPLLGDCSTNDGHAGGPVSTMSYASAVGCGTNRCVETIYLIPSLTVLC